MNTIFMTAKNHRFRLNLRSKINLKVLHRHIALSNLSIYYSWRNVTKKLNNGKFKIMTPSWNEEFELPEGSYTVADINDYFQFIVEKHTKDHKDDIKIYVNKTANRVTFKLKTGVILELMTPETQRFLGSSTNAITSEINGDLAPQMKSTDVVLVHCNLVNDDYQHDSRVLYLFVPESFG